jgi:hypothetical protein
VKNLINVINVAETNKPALGQPCNSCGWCCLTEVCPVGVELTGTTVIPCKLLVTQGDKHYCQLATSEELRGLLAIGQGCDAETQQEKIVKYMDGAK